MSVSGLCEVLGATNHISELTEIIEKHIFVGIVDLTKTLSLLQHSTRLYLVNHCSLAYVTSRLTARPAKNVPPHQ